MENRGNLPIEKINDPVYLQHRYWMSRALELAVSAGNAHEIPVGAVIVDGENHLIAQGENRRERDDDPTAHAEIIALRVAGRTRQNWHLDQCILYVTLEPCPMCAGAIAQSRLKLLVYGADDPKTGAIRTVMNIPDSPCSYHQLSVLGGIMESDCRQLLQSWFIQRRSRNHDAGKTVLGAED